MPAAKSPFVRVTLVLICLVMLFFASTREFLKITFFMGIPFLLFYTFMGRQRRYSILWAVSGILVIGVLVAYGYFLVQLPERIAVREIISEGGALVAEEKYDAAIVKYQQLEKYGQTEKMEEKIANAKLEKKAADQLKQAEQKMAAGDKEAAREIVKNIPASSRAAVKARKLREELGL